MSDDDRFYKPNLQPPARLSLGQPGEPLFEFSRASDHSRFRVELRDHGEVYGVECQIFQDGELWSARRFDPRLDASRPSREMAIAWATEQREALEQAGS